MQIIYARSVNYIFILDISQILDNTYIWVLLVNSESILLLAFVKYMLYSHCTQNCIFLVLLEAKSPCFVAENCSKSSYICVFILSKQQHNWLYKKLLNSGMVDRRKLLDPSLNQIFNALPFGVQYMLSFHWTNFGLKCLQVCRIQWYSLFPFLT